MQGVCCLKALESKALSRLAGGTVMKGDPVERSPESDLELQMGNFHLPLLASGTRLSALLSLARHMCSRHTRISKCHM